MRQRWGRLLCLVGWHQRPSILSVLHRGCWLTGQCHRCRRWVEYHAR